MKNAVVHVGSGILDFSMIPVLSPLLSLNTYMEINVLVSAHFSIYDVWFCKRNSDLSMASGKQNTLKRKGRLVKWLWEAHALQNRFLRRFFAPGDRGQRETSLCWKENYVTSSIYRVSSGCHLHLVSPTTQRKTSALYVCTSAVDRSI